MEIEHESRDEEATLIGAFQHPTRAVGGQEDGEYFADGQGCGSSSQQEKRVQQRLHSHNGKDARTKTAPWRERRRMTGVPAPQLGIRSRQDVEIWSPDQVADWLLTISLDPSYIDYAEAFKRHRIRGANLSRLDFRLLTCMGVVSVGHQIDILQAIDRLFQSSEGANIARPSGSTRSRSRCSPSGNVVGLTDDKISLQFGGGTQSFDHRPDIALHLERRPPPPQPSVKDRRYAESLPGGWDHGYQLPPNPYYFDREPSRSAGGPHGARSTGSPDSPWFYSSDDDRASSLYYSRASSDFTSPSSSYSDIRTSGRMRVTSPLVNDQWETDSRWYDERQRPSPRRRHSSKEKDRRSEEVRTRLRDRQTNPSYDQDDRFSRNHSAESFREQSIHQYHQVPKGHIAYQQRSDIRSCIHVVNDDDQRMRTTNMYYRETSSSKQQAPGYREVSTSVDDAVGPKGFRRNMRSRSDHRQGTQSVRGVNPFDRFSSLRTGGVRTKKDSSSYEVALGSPTNESKPFDYSEEDKHRESQNDFSPAGMVTSNDGTINAQSVPVPTLSSRSNVTTDSGLPPSVRQSPVRSQRDSQDNADDQVAGYQQRVVGRRVERQVRQRRKSEGQEDRVRIDGSQNKDIGSRLLEIPIEGTSQPSSPMEDTNESQTRLAKSLTQPSPVENNKGLIKHALVKFILNTSSIDTKEFVVHRLAAILHVNKDRLMSNVTSTESPSGKCVTLTLEMSAVRQLRQILESDKDQLAPLNAISVQIGSDQEVTLQKPRSLMKALENSNLRMQNSHFLKIVVVGDAACGKTSFIRAYVNNKRCTGEYNPTVSDTFDCCISIGKEPVMLQIHDTASLEGYEKLRPDAYRGCDLVVICFCIARQSSLHNVEDYWCPEIRIHNATAPIVVAGLQKDLRDDYEMSSQVYRTKYQPPVKAETARRIAGSIHALYYRECSSVTMQGVKELFDLIVYMAYEHKKRQCRKTDNRAKCNVL